MTSVYDQRVIILLMGVQGSGKTTVGRALAERLGWGFRDADEFHPAANVAKMAAGIALNDEDRAPWLAAIRAEMDRANAEHRNLVLTCSALKEQYRQQLAAQNTKLVFLKGDFSLIASRLRARAHHFAKVDLLPSQFEQLEEPHDALVVDIHPSVAEIVEGIVRELKLQ
jgi:gluconokinase